MKKTYREFVFSIDGNEGKSRLDIGDENSYAPIIDSYEKAEYRETSQTKASRNKSKLSAILDSQLRRNNYFIFFLLVFLLIITIKPGCHECECIFYCIMVQYM